MALHRGDRDHTPVALDPCERLHAAILESETRPASEFRGSILTPGRLRLPEGRDAGTHTGDSGELFPDALALTEMNTGSHLDPQLTHGSSRGAGAGDRRRGLPEAAEEAVTARVEFPTPKRLSSRRTILWCRSSNVFQRRSPSSSATDVDSTMSVKSTAARCAVWKTAGSYRKSRVGVEGGKRAMSGASSLAVGRRRSPCWR
jgi:hypothetical protein